MKEVVAIKDDIASTPPFIDAPPNPKHIVTKLPPSLHADLAAFGKKCPLFQCMLYATCC
jgi:hypothetical protein